MFCGGFDTNMNFLEKFQVNKILLIVFVYLVLIYNPSASLRTAA